MRALRWSPLLAAWLACAVPATAATVNVIPEPNAADARSGPSVVIAPGAAIVVPTGDPGALNAARELRALALKTRGLALSIRTSGEGVITLSRAGSPAKEAYALDAEGGHVRITAASDAGLFYGAVTLWQLMTAEPGAGAASIAPVHIDDAPRFAWRGVLLDSARHYQSVAFIERLIDVMATHKLNVLQWHLTDDQAWRLQIRKYPKLTSVGAWRTPVGVGETDPKTGALRPYGGFYTQAQVRRIVAYAAARNVAIVPEIEMPGHALSAMLAYPELSAAGPAPRAAQSDWGIFPYIYNYDEAAFAFLEDVLAEVVDLFPGSYVAVGGDEAVKDQWKASPAIQARIKALGLANEDALQGMFTRRIGAFLEARHRRLVGWDDILAGGALPDATVTSWHGPDGAVAAARAGHDVIMATDPVLYFDHRQSDLPSEPPGRGVVITVRDLYAFEPAPAALAAADAGHIIGLQANVWTEHIRTEARLEAMTFPRAAAVAEVGWSEPGRRDWPGFAARLVSQMGRYRALGVAADESVLAVRADPAPDALGQIAVTLSTQLGLGQIRYTADGAEPGPASPLYTAPLGLSGPQRLRAAAFDGDRRLGGVTDLALGPDTLARRTSQELRGCTNKLVLNLEGARADGRPAGPYLVDIMNPCWVYPSADLAAATRLVVAVTRLKWNFQLGADLAKIPVRAPQTPGGELEVRQDSCGGELVASLPLGPAALQDGVTELTVQLPPRAGRHDLCIAVNAKGVDPIWALDWVSLGAAPRLAAAGTGR